MSFFVALYFTIYQKKKSSKRNIIFLLVNNYFIFTIRVSQKACYLGIFGTLKLFEFFGDILVQKNFKKK